MGGLINSSTVKGDLWLIEAGGTMACYPLLTTAEGPGPRVGHASLLVGNAFIVYGGDTKNDESDVLDETLYLLNTSTRQWSRALPSGTRPAGRYGHSLNILRSKIYVFGGQVEGYFMNDLAAFDLNQLQMPNNQWELLIQNSDTASPSQGKIPPARTNHSMIAYNDKMYLFGGTNGFQWFNDMWCYDPVTNSWTQLDCIGYIPVPREGHAAALVDDVMYIFGGRTEEGSDLGDLAAFRITSRRWYTFQNMGPSPSARSGHSMTAVDKMVVVIGGEPSSATIAVNDLALVYCLDTSKIRYPTDFQANQDAQKTTATRRPSDIAAQNVGRSMPVRDGSAGPADSKRLIGTTTREISPLIGPNGQRSPNGVDVPPPVGPPNGVSKLPKPAPPLASIGPPPQGQAPKPAINPAAIRAKNMFAERSGLQKGSPAQSPVLQQHPVSREGETPTANGRRTPTQQHPGRSGSRQAEAIVAEESKLRPPKQARGVDSSAESTLKQVVNRPSSPPPPTRQTSNPISKKSSQRNSQTVTLLKELDAARSRNAWFASELELARKAGYLPNASLSPVLDSRAAGTFDDDDKPLIEALLAMRTELSNVQTSVDKQAALAAEQIAEAEKQRDAAIQEAIYAKAKLAARTGTASSTPQLDNERNTDLRAGEMSRKLGNALNAQKDLQDRLERMNAEIEAEKRARKLADDTTNVAQKRMAELENYKQQNSSEVERLKAKLHMAQREAREQSVAAAEAIATVQMLRINKDELEDKYNDSLETTKEDKRTFMSLRDAVAASTESKTLLERKLDEERALREKAEAKLNKLKGEHEARTAELVVAAQRLRDTEEVAEQHANEARLHRHALISGLDKLSTRDVSNTNKADSDRIAALEGQLSAANALVRKYQQEADSASDRLRGAEERIAGLEAYQEQASREGVSIRRQLQNALRETQSLQAANSDLKQQLAQSQLETNAMLVQYNTLKNILSERGISPTSAARARGLGSPRDGSPRGGSRGGSPEQMRLRELEQHLVAAQAAHEESKSMAAQQAQEAETAYREKLAQLENDYQSAVHYVKGTEKMLKQLKEQISRYKAENTRLKEQLVELEDKLESGNAAANTAPADWETQRQGLQARIDELQVEVEDTAAQLEKQMHSIRQELADARRERDSAAKSNEEANRRLDGSRKDFEQLQQENTLLEDRAQEAEQKVSSLLDQVEFSVDSYRRRSKQVPSLGSETIGSVATPTAANPMMGHSRQESSETESIYGGVGMEDVRNSTALDNLANELETLRSHWETTSKNYRLSNTFDLDPNPPAAVAVKKDEHASLGLSESLAHWRKRLDDSNPDGPRQAK
ncbi:hypothetical protein B0T17DRAFT_542852 [Bombardia bombarda]|uniref:Tip elongation aberrant protein 1 n=1 Tax=Bombardia bombarda TaxID=252184 RepID=A0AA39T2N7_9PEZI|nr:hypothetical protein B0T17DRAFT_542852 [Bombardia bombarda]